MMTREWFRKSLIRRGNTESKTERKEIRGV